MYVHTDRARCTQSTKLQNISKYCAIFHNIAQYHTILHTDWARCTRVHKIAKYRTLLACKVKYPWPLVHCKVLAVSMLHLHSIVLHMLHLRDAHPGRPLQCFAGHHRLALSTCNHILHGHHYSSFMNDDTLQCGYDDGDVIGSNLLLISGY